MSSWFTGLAGKAEEFLNRFDEEASKVLSASKPDNPPVNQDFEDEHRSTKEYSRHVSPAGLERKLVEGTPAASLPRFKQIQNVRKMEDVDHDQDLFEYLNSSTPPQVRSTMPSFSSEVASFPLSVDERLIFEPDRENVPNVITDGVTHDVMAGTKYESYESSEPQVLGELESKLPAKDCLEQKESAGRLLEYESLHLENPGNEKTQEIPSKSSTYEDVPKQSSLKHDIVQSVSAMEASERIEKQSRRVKKGSSVENRSSSNKNSMTEPDKPEESMINETEVRKRREAEEYASELEKKQGILQLELLQLRTAFQQTSEDLKNKEVELYGVTDQLAGNCSVVDKMRREKKVMEGQIRELEDNESRKEKMLSQAQAALELEKQTRIDENRTAKEQVESLSAEVQMLRERCDSEVVYRNQEQSQLNVVVEKKEKELAELNASFEEYKAKAQRILSSKDKLITSLKSVRGHGSEALEESPELQEAREEILMLKEELSSLKGQLFACQRHVNDLEKEVAEGGNREQEFKERWKFQEQRIREVIEERQRTAQELVLFQKEMSSQKSSWMESVAEKDREIGRLNLQMTAMSRGNSSPPPPPLQVRSGGDKQEKKIHALTQSLLQKQTLIENLTSQCNSFQLQLERIEEQQRRSKAQSTAISLTDDAKAESTSSDSVWQSPYRGARSRHATWIDRGTDGISHLGNLMTYYLRRYPTVRLAAVGYAVVLHIWVFIVLMTYKPEIHDEGAMLRGVAKPEVI